MLIKGDASPVIETAHGGLKKVFLKNGDVPHLTQVAHGEIVNVGSTEQCAHAHETMWEVYYILAGVARYVVGDVIHEVRPGDVVAVPPKTRHFQDVLEAPHRFLYWGVAVDGPSTQ